MPTFFSDTPISYLYTAYQQIKMDYKKISGQIAIVLLSVLLFTVMPVNGMNSTPVALPKTGNYTYGRIIDRETKEPIAGVVIYLEGNNIYGATSDNDGYYILKLPKDGGKVTYSCLGYETRTAAIKYRQMNNIEMSRSMESINEVIVTGYNSVRKESFTGNSIRISKKALLNANPDNLISAIQVFDPSFRIIEDISSGSDPNKMPKFVMRGLTGIGETVLEKNAASAISREVLSGNSNLPIFILDGFEVDVEKIYDLDINSIHSINILKDAAATAVYGSRAANGVIVIERRAPEAGKIRASYSGMMTVEIPDLSSYNLMNAAEKVEAERLAGLYDSKFPEIDPYNNNYYSRLNNVITGVDTYWPAQGLRTSIDQKHSVFIDGGENDVRWGIDLSYRGNKGVMKQSFRNTTRGGFYIDYRIKGLQIRNKASYTHNKSASVPFNTFATYTHLLPYMKLYDESGRYVRKLETFGGYRGTLVNPLYEMEFYKSFDNETYDEFADNLSLNWYITKGLRLKGYFSSLLRTNTMQRYKDPASASYSSNSGAINGEKTERLSKRSILDGGISLIYNRQLKKHYINLCLSTNIRQTSLSASSIIFQGFPGGNLVSPNYAAKVYGKPSYADNKVRLAGSLLTANYSYKDIYLADITGRIDGSSEFGSNKKWSTFYAVGAGINIHKYQFLKDNKIISTLKIRGSYGLTGKTNFSLYAAKDMYELQADSWYPTGYGVFLYQKGNPNLKWERKYTLDGGFELGLLRDDIYMRISGYSERTIDLISDYTLPSSSGFTSYKDNMGKVMNRGIELDLRVKLYSDKNWLLQLHGNFASNRNTILEISQAMKDYNKRIEEIFSKFKPGLSGNSNFAKTYMKYYEGASLTSIYGMRSLGISPSNGKEIYLKKDGTATDKWSAEEWSVIGDAAPKGQGAFGFTLAYKQFSLFTSFMYTFGGDAYNNTLVSYVENVDIKNSNVDRRVLWDRWKKPGDVTVMKDIKDRNKTTGASSRFVQRNNTLRFNSLTLNYSIPKKLTEKMHLVGMRFSLSMNDLMYLSTIRRERGLDYPYSKTFNFSVNVIF